MSGHYLGQYYLNPQSCVRFLKNIQENSFQIRHDMSQRMKHQLRRMPKFWFYIDDSLDYVDGIEKAFKQLDNPIKDAKGLPKRQKK